MTTKPERRPRLRPGLALLLATLALLLTVWPGAAGVRAQSDTPQPPAPAGVTAADGPQTGAVNITWNPVAGAAFYRIGWVKMADIPVAQAAGRHWLDAFAFTDIANLGQTAHTLTDLRPAADYAFIIGSVNARFATAAWSEWAYLTPAAASCSAASSGNPAGSAATAPPTTGIAATDAGAPGAVFVSWAPDAVTASAGFYRIGWVKMADIPVARAAGRHWLDAFAFTDVANLGQTAHTLTDLRPGADYAFIIGSVAARFGNATWSEWAYLTPAAASCSAGSIATDRAALVALYRATDGDNWTKNTNWLSDAPLGHWHGVTTDKDGRVIELILEERYYFASGTTSVSPKMNLSGELPAELGSLDRLRELSLRENKLTGTIPAELGNLANLHTLILSGNALTGGIPMELGNLANLHTLAFSGNVLTGGIPAELGNLGNLHTLYLNGNVLTGEIPVELGNLGNLHTLYLNGNALTGGIPAELGNLDSLRTLDLNSNVLTGEIPAELSNLDNLQFLYLNDNVLTGGIPAELGNLDNLQFLYLNDNALTGEIPTELGNLEHLYLRGNRLSGCIPAAWQISARRWTNDLNRLDLPFCNDPSDPAVYHQSDRAVLVALYNATDGPNWHYNHNWTGDSPIWEWAGVTVPLNGRVTEIYLNGYRLTGEIPAELGNLANLRKLLLGNNRLTGGIPTELGNLTNLRELSLYNNQLTGGIPVELSNLANLRRLFLGGNQLTGRIPVELGNLANLERLSLSGNQLTGCIPESLRKIGDGLSASGLMFCDLTSDELALIANDRAALVALYNAAGGPNWNDNSNWLSTAPLGQWHGVVADNHGRVTALSLSDNLLIGEMPAELGSLANLRTLYLYDNHLTGAIPAELGSLANLRTLYLYDNHLTGAIPAELGNLDVLENLAISSNRLTGAIPTELSNLANLRQLYLNGNRLTGAIPTELGNLANLRQLYLESNRLSGAVPTELGSLANLRELYLHSNDLTGMIPAELGRLANLHQLHLGGNGLTGPIPVELGNLASLRSLHLYNNFLTGGIPAELGDLANLERLYLNDNDLTGTIPAELGNLANLQQLYLSGNHLTGCVPQGLSDVPHNDFTSLALSFCNP